MKGRRFAVAVAVAFGVAMSAAPAAQGASGTFERAWGKDVVNGGGTGYEICTVALDCKFGLGTGDLGGELASPNAVAVDSVNNFVYVADTDNDRIQKFDLSGNFLRSWGKDVVNGGGTGFEVCTNAATCQGGAATTGLGGEMNSPEGVAVDDDGNVYVSERLNNRIEKFTALGSFIAAWGKDVDTAAGTGFEVCVTQANCKVAAASTGKGGEFNSPNGIASDGFFVYVADRVNNRIQKLSKAGLFIRTWGKDVDTGGGTGVETCTSAASCKAGAASTGLGGELNTPVAVAVDDTGNAYVADTNASQVQKFSDVGVWERTWGKDVVSGGGTGFEVCTVAATCKAGDNSGALGGELNQPIGIAADATSVFVSDPYSSRLQQFDPSGRFFALWGGDVVNGGGTGFELCTDAALCKLGVTTGAAGGLMQLPAGLAANGSTLYLADEGNNRMQRFGVEPPVFPPPATPAATTPPQPVKKKKCKRRKHKRSAESAKKKKCKKKRKK